MGARKSCLTVALLACALCLVSALTSTVALAAGPPTVDSESVAQVGITSATLEAEINPNEVATSYRFEYGPDNTYGTSVPVADLGIGEGSSDRLVSQAIGSLVGGSSYHYRVVAINADGTVYGTDKVFKTFPVPAPVNDRCSNAAIRQAQSASGLPDCRAYEMVSPPDVEKEGADIMGDPYNEVASRDGNAFVFESSSYGDANAITMGAQYLAMRTPEGWSSHGIDPVQGSLHEGLISTLQGNLYVGFSDDLSKGAFLANTPVLAGHPNVEKLANLYLRTNLLEAQSGAYELLTDSVAPAAGVSMRSLEWIRERRPTWIGSSADWRHIIFISRENLTTDAPAQSAECVESDSGCEPRLYEWDEGLVKLVGILPNGTAASSSIAGGGSNQGSFRNLGVSQETYRRHVISQDGSRVIFQAGPLERIRQVWAGGLYMRLNGERTIQLNASERTDCADHNPCTGAAEPDPAGPQPALFDAATPDDSKIFFQTKEALTDNVKADGLEDLYMYDTNAPEGKHLTLISVDREPNDDESNRNRAIGVSGISEDGSYVYFVGEGDLVPGMPPTPEWEHYMKRLYVWHDGTIRYITDHRGIEPLAGWNENQENAISKDAFRVSRDGKTVAFMSGDPSTAAQAGFDNTASPVGKTEIYFKYPCSERYVETAPRVTPVLCHEVYTYNYDADKIECASCNSTGALPDGDASFTEYSDLFAGVAISSYLNHPLTEDGRYVFFDSPEALVSQDVNGQTDVYEYDTKTAEVSLLSTGSCDCKSTFIDASADGSNVFFTTRQVLVTADGGTSADLYDVRVDGGIPNQNQPVPVACSGEECQGPVGSAPVFSVPSSATFAGVGNRPSQRANATPTKRAGHAKHKRKHKKRRRHKKSNSTARLNGR